MDIRVRGVGRILGDTMGPLKREPLYAIPVANHRDAAPPRMAKAEFGAAALEACPATSLRPPPGIKLSNVADLPFENFEPPPELLKSSGQHLGGKILKLLKLRKKPTTTTTATYLPMDDYFHQPPLRVLHIQDLISHSTQFPSPHLDDVSKRYQYDSDEHSGNYASDTQSSSSASVMSSSSRNSNSVFDSHRSLGSSGRLSSSRLMATILMSIMDDEDSTASDEYQGSSEDDHAILDGPHESAWHNPRDEPGNADSPTVRGRQSSSIHSSRRHTPKAGIMQSAVANARLTSPGPSRRFGKLDLSRNEVYKLR